MPLDILSLRSHQLEQKNEEEPVFSMLMVLTGLIFTTICVQRNYDFFRVKLVMELNSPLKICFELLIAMNLWLIELKVVHTVHGTKGLRKESDMNVTKGQIIVNFYPL